MTAPFINPLARTLDVSLPKWIFLQLLENCNLRCRMCYEWGDTVHIAKKKR